MSGRGGRDLDCKVYVGSLSRDVIEKDLEKAFSHYGPLKSVWVARKPAGFGFVEFDDPRDADDAVRGLDGSNIEGSRIRVEHSSGKVRDKPWQRGGYGGGDRGYSDRGYGGRDSDRRDNRGNGRAFDPSDKCYECGERGHYAYDCRNRGSGHGGGGGGGSRRSRSRSRSPRRKSYSRSRSHSRKSSRSKSRSSSRDRDLVN